MLRHRGRSPYALRVRSPRVLACASALALTACGSPRAELLADRIDRAVERAATYLAASQEEDGAWRSRTYAALKDGWALTATCTKALAFGPGGEESLRAVARGISWLESAVGEGGEIDPGPAGLPYPVYTASLAVIVMARADPARAGHLAQALAAWLRLLERHQLTEQLGWSPADAPYGGWSYALHPPRKGAGGAFEADLSSTLFALGALRAAGRGAEDPAVRRALAFIERCQNLPLPGQPEDPPRDDGGFFMSPTIELQNKAGHPHRAGSQRTRFASYGSMTADGLRALLRCGLARDHARVQSALAWLSERFRAESNPGDFEPVREVERDAAWFYWTWSAAHAFAELALSTLPAREGPRRWAEDLAEALLARQRQDGSWSNPLTMMKEDDPLVATPMALATLSLCRLSIQGMQR